TPLTRRIPGDVLTGARAVRARPNAHGASVRRTASRTVGRSGADCRTRCDRWWRQQRVLGLCEWHPRVPGRQCICFAAHLGGSRREGIERAWGGGRLGRRSVVV